MQFNNFVTVLVRLITTGITKEGEYVRPLQLKTREAYLLSVCPVCLYE